MQRFLFYLIYKVQLFCQLYTLLLLWPSYKGLSYHYRNPKNFRRPKTAENKGFPAKNSYFWRRNAYFRRYCYFRRSGAAAENKTIFGDSHLRPPKAAENSAGLFSAVAGSRRKQCRHIFGGSYLAAKNSSATQPPKIGLSWAEKSPKF